MDVSSLTRPGDFAADPAAPVIELVASAPGELRSYWVIGSDIQFILDADRKPNIWHGRVELRRR